MSDLKTSLGGLRIDHERRTVSRTRWHSFVPWVVAVALGALQLAQSKVAARLTAPAFDTFRPTITGGQITSSKSPILTSTGYVVARRKAVVSAKIPGRLAKLEVDEGAHVIAGEVIARLEDSEYRAQVRRARAGARSAEATLAEQRRQLKLAERLLRANVVTINQRDAAQSQVDVAAAALQQARADIEVQEALSGNTLIRAPFTGTILRKMAEVGESVAPLPPGANISTSSGAVFVIADTDALEVESDIGEVSLSKLKIDQPAEVVVDSFPDQRFEASLRAITPVADRTKATVLVHVTIRPTEATRALKPEMAAKLTFVESPVEGGSAPPRAIFVSRSALVRRGTGDLVYEVRGGSVHALPVSLGEASGNQVLVKAGLSGNELLVANPNDTINEGDAVKVKK